MATQTIEFRSPPSQTVTAKLFAVGSDTQVDSQSATEATNRKGTYAAAYTDVAAGEYELIAFVGAVPVARWFVTLTLTTATFQVYDKAKTELIAANAVNAASLATDAVTEIQSGLATATNVSDAQTAIIAQVDANETKIDAVKAKTDNLPSDPADQSAVEAAITAATSPLATAANLATVAGYLDTEIAAILADTNELQSDWADGGRLDLILDARASQTSVDDLPTNSELATALGTADDAVLAAIATVQSDTNDIQTRLPAALESGRIAAVLDSAATAAIADAVLTESILDHRNVAHSLAKYIWQIRQANLTIDGTVSNAITPTTLTFSSNVAATTSAYAHAVLLFVTGPLTGENSPIISYNSTNGVFLLEEALTAAPSNGDEFVVIAGSHVHSVADIQSGLATSAALAAAKAILDKVDTGLVVDGAVYQFTANMLELGPAGGTATVAVLPATGIVADRTAGTTLTPVVGETISQSITLYQTDGTTAVSLSGKTLKIIFETMSGVDVAVVLAADITISGASSNVVTFAYPSAVTASERTLRFAIRDAATPLTMYLQGVCSVVAAPKVDA
jgi:hypothetical protein